MDDADVTFGTQHGTKDHTKRDSSMKKLFLLAFLDFLFLAGPPPKIQNEV